MEVRNRPRMQKTDSCHETRSSQRFEEELMRLKVKKALKQYKYTNDSMVDFWMHDVSHLYT